MSWRIAEAENLGVGEERGGPYDTQRPAIFANGVWPIELITGSHPSSSSGMAAGACGALISNGPFTALRLLPGTSCMRSPLRVRFTVVCSTDGAAVVVVDETS